MNSLFRPRKAKLALLVAAHCEELVLERTLRSAVRAGMRPQDIYVVDDNSSDSTSEVARRVLPAQNVHKVRRSGKGLALTKASKKFRLPQRYQWIHIADADGGFAPDYFKIFRRELDTKYAAATGYVRALPGNNISQFRVFEYTIGMEIHRRFQALAHTVSVIPGPTSCFRSDVFTKVNFANQSLTEDLDVTLQIHRRRLGHIQFISKAVAYTQDPKNLHDFSRQITRWNRGVAQAMRRHKIGRRAQRIDFYLSYQVLQNFLFLLSYAVIVPYLTIQRRSISVLAMTFLFDALLTFVLTFLVGLRSQRMDILSAFPVIYVLRWVVMYIFLKAFFEVFVLRKFKVSEGIWNTPSRYKTETTLQ